MVDVLDGKKNINRISRKTCENKRSRKTKDFWGFFWISRKTRDLQRDWLRVGFLDGNKMYKVSQKRIFSIRLAERCFCGWNQDV